MRALPPPFVVGLVLGCGCASAPALSSDRGADAAPGTAPGATVSPAADPSSSAAPAPGAAPKIEGVPDGSVLTNGSVGAPYEKSISGMVIDSSGDGYVDVTILSNGLDEQVKSVAFVLEEARTPTTPLTGSCGAGRVLFEIPHAVLGDPRGERARPVFRLAPPLLDPRRGYALTPCGRDATGTLHPSAMDQTTPFALQVTGEPRWASRVDTASGPITSAHLKPGDEILGFDLERKKPSTLAVERIELATVPHTNLVLDDGRSVVVPAARELWIPSTGKFKRASELAFGDVLLRRDGATVSVERRSVGPDLGTALVRARGGAPFFTSGLLARDPKVTPEPLAKGPRPGSSGAASSGSEALAAAVPVEPRAGWTIQAASESYDCMVVTNIDLGAFPSESSAVAVATRPRKGPAGRLGVARCAADDVRAEVDRSFIESLATIVGMKPTRLQLEISATSDCDAGNELSLCARFEDKHLAALLPDAVYGQAGPSCFVAGTPVTTERGEIAIEDLRPGDAVVAFDTRTGQRVTTRVTHLIPREHRPVAAIDLSNGQALRVTAEHPFFVPAEGFVRAEQLSPGDELLGADGERVTVLATTAFEDDETVYDLSVAEPHDYFAGGVLVHNY